MKLGYFLRKLGNQVVHQQELGLYIHQMSQENQVKHKKTHS